MKVKIIKCKSPEYWYANIIGEVFEVEEWDIRNYKKLESCDLIIKSDCKIVENDTQQKIIKVCDEVKNMLLEKNRKYGDAALNPIRIFATADTVEQLKVRIDDKLNRFKNMQKDDTEDVVNDLIGYLILLKVAEERDK